MLWRKDRVTERKGEKYLANPEFEETADLPIDSMHSLFSGGAGIDHRFSTATEGSLGAGASISRDETSGATSVAPVRKS